jgi:hypothetical protein
MLPFAAAQKPFDEHKKPFFCSVAFCNYISSSSPNSCPQSFEPSAATMRGLDHRLSPWYAGFAETPELAKFPRHLQLWSWSLSNQSGNIEKLRKECDKLVAEREGVAPERSDFVVTDYHQIYDDDERPKLDLDLKIKNLTDAIRLYSKSTGIPDRSAC